MRLCFPVESENGLDSTVYAHFGSAPVFFVFDTETNEINTINNQNLNHEHGMCSPLKALGGESVDAIVVGGIGAGAINKLNAMKIRVYRANEGTVRKNITLFQNKSLLEISPDEACGHHGGCSH